MSIKMMILALGAIVLMVGTGIVFFTMQPRSNNVAPDGAEGFIMGPPLEVGGALPPSVYMPSVGRGNTIGNSVNGARVAQSGDWTYVHIRDSLLASTLVRLSYSTNKEEVVIHSTEIPFHSINVVGDWIFFGRETGIYRMLPNGANEEQLTSIRPSASSLTVLDGWIYYSSHRTRVDGITSNSGIYRMRVDGTAHERINDETVAGITVYGEWVYFIAFNENLSIHRMKLDGTNRQRLNYDSSNYMNVCGNWVFFTNRDRDNALYKMQTDGADITRLVDSGVTFLNKFGEWLYFSNANSGGHVYRIHSSGTQMAPVLEQAGFFINITDEWIYFSVGNHEELSLWEFANAPMARVRRDGTGFEYVHLRE